MKDAEVAGGVFALGRGALRGIFHQVKLFHLWREQACSGEGDSQADEQDEDRRFGEKFASVKPVEDQMNERDDGAPLLQDQVAFDQNLRDGPRKPIRTADQDFNFRTEYSGAQNGGKKNHGAQPHRRVEQTDKSEYRGHWREF